MSGARHQILIGLQRKAYFIDFASTFLELAGIPFEASNMYSSMGKV